MYYAVCDKCGDKSSSSLSESDLANNTWPDSGGMTLQISIPRVLGSARQILFCPACVTGMNIHGFKTSDKTERSELMEKFANFIIESGEDAIRDLAYDVMERN